MKTRDGPNTTRIPLDDFNTHPCRSNAVNGFQKVSTCLNIRRPPHPDDAASTTNQPRFCSVNKLGYCWSGAMWMKACLYTSSCIFLSNHFISAIKLRRLPFFPSIYHSLPPFFSNLSPYVSRTFRQVCFVHSLRGRFHARCSVLCLRPTAYTRLHRSSFGLRIGCTESSSCPGIP